MLFQVSLSEFLLPVLGSVFLLGVIVYVFFWRSHIAVRAPPKPSEAISSTPPVSPLGAPMYSVSLEPVNPTPAPRTATSMSVAPVQQAMDRQAGGELQAISVESNGVVGTEELNKTPAQVQAEKVLVLLPYIRQYRSQGFDDKAITEVLKRNEWPENLIQIALKQA